MTSAAKRQIYLTLHTMPDGSSSSVGVDMHDALTWGRDEFAKLYRNSVYRAKKKEALAWADKQIAERERVLRMSRAVVVDSDNIDGYDEGLPE